MRIATPMNTVKRVLLLLCVLVVCVGCDQTTKVLAETSFPSDHGLSFLADTVRLQVAHNDGAFLSLGGTLPESFRVAALRGGVAAMLAVLLVYALFSKGIERHIMFAASLIFSGGVSNLIDRFVHDGYVVDFLNLGVGPLRTGIFNVADIAITAGTLLLLMSDSFNSRTNRKTSG